MGEEMPPTDKDLSFSNDEDRDNSRHEYAVEGARAPDARHRRPEVQDLV
jgi:hypothetical protein